MRVIGYCRVAVADQPEIERQRRAIRSEATRRSWSVRWVKDIGYSGADLGRPGIQRALDLLQRGHADAVLVESIHSLTSSAADLVDVLDRAQRDDWMLVVLTPAADIDGRQGEVPIATIAAVAAADMKTLRRRQRRAATRLTDGTRLEVPPDVAARVRAMADEHDGLARVAEALNRAGVSVPGEADSWQPSMVFAVLAREDSR